jgi:hypothetical protein
MDPGSSILEEVESYKEEIKALEKEVSLKEQLNQTLKKTNEVYEKR